MEGVNEIEGLRVRIADLEAQLRKAEDENTTLRAATADLQNRAEAEEELIANILLKKLNELSEQKNALLVQVEQEEEYLTNTLQKKLKTLEHEKTELETRLEEEQEFIVNKLQRQLGALNEEKRVLQEKIEQLLVSNSELDQSKEELKNLRNQTTASIRKLSQENFLLSQQAERHRELYDKLTKEIARLELSVEMEEERDFHHRYSHSPSSSPINISYMHRSRSTSRSPIRSTSSSSVASSHSLGHLYTLRTLKEGLIFLRQSPTESLRNRYAVLTEETLSIFVSEEMAIESPELQLVLDKVSNVDKFANDSFSLTTKEGDQVEIKCLNEKEREAWVDLIESLVP